RIHRRGHYRRQVRSADHDSGLSRGGESVVVGAGDGHRVATGHGLVHGGEVDVDDACHAEGRTEPVEHFRLVQAEAVHRDGTVRQFDRTHRYDLDHHRDRIRD